MSMRFICITWFSLFSLMITACSCIGSTSVKKEIRRADAVFVGEVISKDTLTEHYHLEGVGTSVERTLYRYRIKVTATYKGQKVDTLSVTTGVGHGDCGFGFEIGKNYVIYAEFRTALFNGSMKLPPFLYTNICWRTRVSDSDEIRQIEVFRKPKK